MKRPIQTAARKKICVLHPVIHPPGSKEAEQESDLQVNSILRLQIQKNIDLLKLQAKRGDINCMRLLHKISVYATEQLNSLAAINLELLKEFASQQVYWPVVYEPPFKSKHKEFLKFFTEIDLGTKPVGMSPLLFGQITVPKLIISQVQNEVLRFQYHQSWRSERLLLEKKWGPELAKAMVVEWPMPASFKEFDNPEFEETCLDIGPLSHENWREWLEVIKIFIKMQTAGAPEKIPVYRGVGMFRAKHGGAEKGSSQFEDNIRDGLWLAIKQTLQRYVGAEKDKAKPYGRSKKKEG